MGYITHTAVRRMIPPAKIFCCIATLMALLTAQLVGLAKGYWCECVGAPAPVASAECQPAECHPAVSHSICCQDSGVSGSDCGSGEGRNPGASDAPKHTHKFATQEADFQGFTPVVLPVPLLFVETYAGVPPITWLEDVPVACGEIPPVRRDGWRCPPPMAVTVLRTQVLLV